MRQEYIRSRAFHLHYNHLEPKGVKVQVLFNMLPTHQDDSDYSNMARSTNLDDRIAKVSHDVSGNLIIIHF